MTQEQNDQGEVRQKLGTLSEQFFTRKLEIDEIEDGLRHLKAKQEAIKDEMDAILETEDMEKYSSKFGSHSRTVNVYPSLEDFPAFVDWVQKTGSHEFIQKRVNALPVRQMLESDGVLPPGVSTYMKATVNSRISPSGRKLLMSK